MGKSVLRFFSENIKQNPGFQKTETVGKHLNVCRDDRHRSNTYISGFIQSVEKNNEGIKSVKPQNKSLPKEEIVDKTQNIA